MIEKILSIILDRCSQTLDQKGFKPENILQQSRDEASEIAFLQKLESGQRFYGDRLWERAARIWAEAFHPDRIPPLYQNKINRTEIETAESALRRGEVE